VLLIIDNHTTAAVVTFRTILTRDRVTRLVITLHATVVRVLKCTIGAQSFCSARDRVDLGEAQAAGARARSAIVIATGTLPHKPHDTSSTFWRPSTVAWACVCTWLCLQSVVQDRTLGLSKRQALKCMAQAKSLSKTLALTLLAVGRDTNVGPQGSRFLLANVTSTVAFSSVAGRLQAPNCGVRHLSTTCASVGTWHHVLRSRGHYECPVPAAAADTGSPLSPLAPAALACRSVDGPAGGCGEFVFAKTCVDTVCIQPINPPSKVVSMYNRPHQL
jgi:hypothetical protein